MRVIVSASGDRVGHHPGESAPRAGREDIVNVKSASRGEARAWLDEHLARIESDHTSECIIWPFSTNGGSGGKYPQIKIGGAIMRVSRYLWERLSGHELAAGELVRHWCDQPRCVNPWHLEVGDHRANMRDMRERGRQAVGERNGRARLTERDVQEIRELARTHDTRGNAARLARAYGVSTTTIALIVAGRMWRDVGATAA
jgi:hypothetical protein